MGAKSYMVVVHLNVLIVIVFFNYSVYKVRSGVVIFLESKIQNTHNATFFIMKILNIIKSPVNYR